MHLCEKWKSLFGNFLSLLGSAKSALPTASRAKSQRVDDEIQRATEPPKPPTSRQFALHISTYKLLSRHQN